MRAQGVMVTDAEIGKILEFWRKMTPVTEGPPPWEEVLETGDENVDGLVEAAIGVVRSSQRASTSLLQRRLRIGYPRAARLIDELEQMGIVGPAQAGGREREVLIGAEDEEEGDGNLEDDA
jgi:S-DNA-T family DNA segregation ATPase FtsK/SpoIIIE